MLIDNYQRPIQDLRISLTDKCNYHCFYCKPSKGSRFHYRSGTMSHDEIVRISKIFLTCGVSKIRLTGGEPMLHKNLSGLIKSLSSNPRLNDLAMTTNGHFLEAKAKELKKAGLHRLTISLDTLKPERFHNMTEVDAFDRVMRGIDAASKAGFFPLKLNVVIIRGVNDDEILDFANFSKETGHIIRFIEFMPLDANKKWSSEKVVPMKEIIQTISSIDHLRALPPNVRGETAKRFQFLNHKGEIGVIASVSNAFCGQCSRIRLTADGKLRTCLFSQNEHDLLSTLRSGADDQHLTAFIRQVVNKKEAGHNINLPEYLYPKKSMSSIGG